MATSAVRTVHLVAKTHLDLGFTDLADAVAQRYVDEFFPRAIAVADELRSLDGTDGAPRLVWSTGSWILREALDRRGSDAQQAAVAEAVERGDLAWHGLPLTFHTELLDADLFRHALSISARLDERFGRRTTAAKMTDVPGHTRSMVPLLAEAGIGFLHLGVNPAWPVPEAPPVFRWRSPDGTEVVVAYSAGGYGADVAVPGCDAVLSFLHSGDNLGPPSVDEVLAAHAALADRYPAAEVRASTLSAFADALAASGAIGQLPVVTSEIGDPWLFGAGSDPQKVTAYRALLDRRVGLDGPDREALDDRLLLVAEHTWGLDQKVVLPTEQPWDDGALARLRADPAGQRFEASWAEQRSYVAGAPGLVAAPVHGSGPDPARVAEVPVDGVVPFGGHWSVRVDVRTGAIAGLRRIRDGWVVADEEHPLGLLTHQTFSAADYDRFYGQLTPSPEDEWWAVRDNTKPGIDVAGATSSRVVATSSGAWWRAEHDGGSVSVVVRAGFATDRPGAPPEAWLRWTWVDDDDLDLSLEVWWDDKPATRQPEATWLSFVPLVDEPSVWTMDKLGQPVSPLDVVRRGGRSLHAVGRGGLTYDGPDGPLHLETPDAPLVAPGRPNLLDADPPVPDLAGGWHVLLHDNCWGTNFPMWNEGPAGFGFRLSVSS